MLEQVLTDIQKADPEWNVILLRYFNPIGAHKSGLIGEDPKGIPNNLLPYVAQVAIGKLKCLGVFGNDYDTPDGTGVRDYIHVVDLAKGHVKAIKKLADKEGVSVYNLGTGNGYSVLQVVAALKRPAAMPFPMRLLYVYLLISPPATAIPPRQRKSWAGRLRTVLMRCAPTPGTGSRKILTDTVNKSEKVQIQEDAAPS